MIQQCIVSVCFCLGALSATFAQTAPQIHAQDIVKALSAPAQPNCNRNSWVIGDDGTRVHPKCSTLGFNIGDLPSGPVHQRGARHLPMRSVAASGSEQLALVEPSKDLLLTFDTGSADMTPQDKLNAEEFAKALQDPKLGGYRFRIEGYTDAAGPPAFNVTLSQLRAKSAKDYLISIGVDASRIDSEGFGPVLIRPDAPLDRANRRVIARRIE